MTSGGVPKAGSGGRPAWSVAAQNALSKAVREWDITAAQFAIDSGAGLTEDDQFFGLEEAAIHGKLEMCRFLLDAGASPGLWSGSALKAASRKGHDDIVALLVGRGVESTYFRLALRQAARYQRVATSKLLIAAGADPSELDTSDRAKLMMALGQADIDLARTLNPDCGNAEIKRLADGIGNSELANAFAADTARFETSARLKRRMR